MRSFLTEHNLCILYFYGKIYGVIVVMNCSYWSFTLIGNNLHHNQVVVIFLYQVVVFDISKYSAVEVSI